MLRAQCRLFMVGSSLFAVGTAPGFADVSGSGTSNLLCCVGSWFFTSAALLQLKLSTPSGSRSRTMPAIRAEFVCAATQFFGTLNFNLSTGAAVWARGVATRTHLMWWPDAVGSVAFLVSGAFGLVAARLAVGLVRPKSRKWLAAWISMSGSIAFGASAVGAFITTTGTTNNALLAQLGTFVGALCFFTVARLRLPAGSSGGAAQT